MARDWDSIFRKAMPHMVGERNGTNVPVSRADRMVAVELVNQTTGERYTAGQTRSFAPTDADRAWVERELGDVERRVANFTIGGDTEMHRIPVESLGRES